MSRRRRISILLCAGAALMAVPAAAQTGDDLGTFGIAPAKQELTARPPAFLEPVQLTNTQRGTFRVEVFAAPLVQGVDGTFGFEDTERGRRIGEDLVELGADAFELGPNDRRDITVRWKGVLPDLRVAPVAIVIQGIPVVSDRPDLANIFRLVSVNLLQLPGEGRREGRFADVRAEQAPPGKGLVFTPVVVNTGNTFETPRDGRVVIKNAAGEKVARGSFKGDLILPGARREYPVLIKAGLPAGDYTVTAAMHFGSDPNLKLLTKPFKLTGVDELPTVSVAIEDLKGEAVAGEPAKITLRVVNNGTDDAAPTVSLELFESTNASHGDKPLDSEQVEVPLLKPKTDTTVEVELGESEKGQEYTVEAELRVDKRLFDDARFTFIGIEEKSFFRKFFDAIKDNLLWIVLVGGLLLLALALLRSQMRMRRRLETAQESPAPAAAPAPAPVLPTPAAVAPTPTPPPAETPVAGPVDVNSATASELMSVPGIGPKAAERIIEHREEFGDFTSLDDLEQINGFTPARIEKLRGHLGVGG